MWHKRPRPGLRRYRASWVLPLTLVPFLRVRFGGRFTEGTISGESLRIPRYQRRSRSPHPAGSRGTTPVALKSLASPTSPTLHTAITREIHHFAYLRGSFDEQPRPHELRDGDAFGEIHAALHGLGYRFGGLHLNYPVPPEHDVIPSYDPTDVIVLTTRPPLDDEAGWDRRRVERSNTTLEREILRHIRPCFKVCKRTQIQLARSAAAHLGQYADRGLVQFRLYEQKKRSTIYSGAHYQRNRDPHVRRTAPSEQDVPRTATFLLVRRLEPNGPTLIVAFGMDGIMTLTWCYLLRTRFAHLLQTPRFVMAEIQTRDIPRQPTSLAFAETWPVQIILDVPPDVIGPPSIDADHAPP